MMILICINSWFFLWKLKEIKNPHSVTFYILSFLICVTRVVNLGYLYKNYAYNCKEIFTFEEYIKGVKLAGAGTIFYYVSVYLKIILGYTQLISVTETVV
jgi:hypothetical protein